MMNLLRRSQNGTQPSTIKLANTELMYSSILQLSPDYPVIIGVSEVENRWCTGRYYRNPQTGSGKTIGFHISILEARGVDVAFCIVPMCLK